MLPTIKEFKEALEESLEICNEADDIGTIHFEMSIWQDWVKTWPPILNEEGGI